MNPRVLGHVLVALGALMALAACTTGPGTGTSRPSASASSSAVAARMGTEVIDGSSATAGASSMVIKASGVFAASGTLKMPIGNPRTFTLRFTGGDLVVLNATGPTSGPVHLDNATCAYSQSWDGTFRVLSGNSTGSYAGATGHGDYVFSSGGIAPKKADGKCGAAGAAIPGGVLGVSLRGPVLLNAAP